MVLWPVAVIAVLLALASWMRAGRVARKLEALSQSYWELRYDFTRLRSQVARLDPDTEQTASTPAAAGGETMGFISISSLKKKGGN
jgi:outer membrane murein-binding lipoprotein Lpp